MNNQVFEQKMSANAEEALSMKRQVWESTGITLDENDPSIAMFLVHHRWLENFYQNQWQTDNQNAKETFHALSPLISQMRETVDLIENKHTVLKQDIDALNAFRDEMLLFFTSKATENARHIVAQEIKEQVSGSIKQLNTKTHWVLMSVLILQLIMVMVFLLKVL